jgi:hypothetical protein
VNYLESTPHRVYFDFLLQLTSLRELRVTLSPGYTFPVQFLCYLTEMTWLVSLHLEDTQVGVPLAMSLSMGESSVNIHCSRVKVCQLLDSWTRGSRGKGGYYDAIKRSTQGRWQQTSLFRSPVINCFSYYSYYVSKQPSLLNCCCIDTYMSDISLLWWIFFWLGNTTTYFGVAAPSATPHHAALNPWSKFICTYVHLSYVWVSYVWWSPKGSVLLYFFCFVSYLLLFPCKSLKSPNPFVLLVTDFLVTLTFNVVNYVVASFCCVNN